MVEQIKLPFPGKQLVEQDDDVLLASLIFLKSRDDIQQAKIGVGCVVRNRVKNPRWWGKNYKQVTFPLVDFLRISEREKNFVSFPVKNGLSNKWDECYLISKGILDNTIQDITFNSDYFFLNSEKLPDWLSSRLRQHSMSQWYVCTLGNIQFYRVELKWNKPT